VAGAEGFDRLAQIEQPEQPEVQIIDDAVRPAAQRDGDAVGFLVVERGQDARAGRQFRHGKVLAQESGYRMRPVKRPNVRTFGIVAGRAGPVKPPATAAQQGEKVSRVLYSYRSAR